MLLVAAAVGRDLEYLRRPASFHVRLGKDREKLLPTICSDAVAGDPLRTGVHVTTSPFGSNMKMA